MPVQTQLQQRRGTAASWTSTNPTLAAGEIGFETDTGKFKIGNGSTAWAALAYSAGATAVTYLFNATSGQTTFSGADANGLTLAYTVGAEQVYLNGVLQVRGSDYTATNGTSIVLASGALTSDVLNVIAYSAMTVTDTYTQAQADAKFVQQTNNFFAGKNKIINGDFLINQRGFTTSTSSNLYPADRTVMFNAGGTCTTSRQDFTPGSAPVAGYEGRNFIRVAISGQSASTDYYQLRQLIENVTTFAGQTVTLSFWAKANSGTPSIAANFVQNFGTGGSPSGATFATTAQKTAITTSWARYSLTFAIASIAGKTLGTTANTSSLELRLYLSAGTAFNSETSTLGIQTNTFDIWGVQVEAGSVATPFQTASGGSPQAELAMCQRYYYRSTSTASYQMLSNFGTGKGTTQGLIDFKVPATMRTIPTSVDFANVALYDYTNAALAITALTIDIYATPADPFLLATVASGVTALRAYGIVANGTVGAYVGVSAEL